MRVLSYDRFCDRALSGAVLHDLTTPLTPTPLPFPRTFHQKLVMNAESPTTDALHPPAALVGFAPAVNPIRMHVYDSSTQLSFSYDDDDYSSYDDDDEECYYYVQNDPYKTPPHSPKRSPRSPPWAPRRLRI